MGGGAGFGGVENQVSFFAETYCSSSASEDKILCESFWLKEFVLHKSNQVCNSYPLTQSKKTLLIEAF